MLPDKETLSRYRLERAIEELETAKYDYEGKKYKAAINRSYYAIFHSIRAVNLLDSFDSSKHSYVIGHFNQYYVHTGEFPKDTYKIIDAAYRIREKCDYQDFYLASRQDAEIQIGNAEMFIKMVSGYLDRKLGEQE